MERKAEYGGKRMPTRKLKTPESENELLKRLLADVHLVMAVLKDLLGKA